MSSKLPGLKPWSAAAAALCAALFAVVLSNAASAASLRAPGAPEAASPAVEPVAAESCNAICQLFKGLGGDRNPPGSHQAAAPPPPAPVEAAPQPAPARVGAARTRRGVSRAARRSGSVPAGYEDFATSAVRDKPGPAQAAGAAAVTPAPASTGPLRVLIGPDETLRPVLDDLAGAFAPKLTVDVVRGRAQPLHDLLTLPTVDMAVVSAPMLADAGAAADKLVYVAKLFGEELHVLAGPDIRSIEDLAGKTVYVGAPGGDGEMVARTVLKQHGVDVTSASGSLEEALASLREGRIAAVIALAPKPYAPIAALGQAGGLHLVPVPYADLGERYDPASFSSADYPGLVRDGERVETASVDAILVAPWWRESSPRQQELATASRTLFEGFPELLKDGRHPKWKETNLAAVVDGKRRLKVADQWVQARMKARRAGDRAAATGE